MSAILGTAREFFDACETGKGWETCREYCRPDATFAAQAGVLGDVRTLEGYCDWMQGMYTPVPDGRYELKFFAPNAADTEVAAVAVFHGTHTGEGGPVPATGKSVAADYVYHIQFDGKRIRHMTKIWNDAHSLQQLGWA